MMGEPAAHRSSAPGGISVVLTVRDDVGDVEWLMEALSRQRRQPDEIVVVDGGSTDGTLEALERWKRNGLPLRIIERPGAGIGEGRNIAIELASNKWIACTDAGCQPDPGWLEAIDRARGDLDFVGGVFHLAAKSPFERALAVTLYPSIDEVEHPSLFARLSHRLFGRRFLASEATGRSMGFRREAWDSVDGFPTEAGTGEDVGFSAAIVNAGWRAAVVPEAAVAWRPRPGWAGNAVMYFRYGIGRAVVANPRRDLIRLVAYAVGATLLVRGPAGARAIPVAAAVGYLAQPAARARRAGLAVHDWWRIPFLAILKDVSQFAGALVGLASRPRQPFAGTPTLRAMRSARG